MPPDLKAGEILIVKADGESMTIMCEDDEQAEKMFIMLAQLLIKRAASVSFEDDKTNQPN